MVTWPSGKAKVCKTFIPRFKSGRHLQKELRCNSIGVLVIFRIAEQRGHITRMKNTKSAEILALLAYLP